MNTATSIGRETARPIATDDTLSQDAETMRSGSYGRAEAHVPARPDRSFTMTFAVAAAILLVAFLVALYFGAQDTNTATAPTATQESLTENAPAAGGNGMVEPGDTTGSTTNPAAPPPPVESAPDPANPDSTTGTGSTGTTTSP